MILGLIACSAAPVPDELNGRSRSSADDDQEDEDQDTKETQSTPAPSSSGSSSSGSPSTPAPSSPTDAGAPTTGPTGACDPVVNVAPAACSTSVSGTTCSGLARCLATAPGAPTGTWGACECGLVPVAITTTTDCSTQVCPATAPNVVGCSLTFVGDDSRGCVARNATNLSAVFLKEGNGCKSGSVNGTLFCSPTPSTQPLNAVTCPMNRPNKFYVGNPNDCPD
jgi:hypothetical protein